MVTGSIPAASTTQPSRPVSGRTVNFYLHLGCAVTAHVDEALFQLEPKDIHLEFQISVP